MSNKTCKDTQLQLSFGLNASSNQPVNNEGNRVINFNEYRTKKEKEFFVNTVDYLIKHLHE